MNRFCHFFVLFYFFSVFSSFSQTTAIALPEVLLSFDAILNDTKVELTWASNTERNNNYFTIEKSKDAVNFQSFLKIRNFGNNSNIISYFDVDFTPYEGVSYYRLTQTDANDKTVSSRIISITNKKEDKTLVLADDETKASIDNKEEVVVLRDEKGEERISKVIVDADDSVRVSADNGSKLDNGTYVIIASSDNKLYSKIIKIQ